MKKMILPIALLIFITSCDQVKVTNSTDAEAVPVRMVHEAKQDEPTPTTPTIPVYSMYKLVQYNEITEFNRLVNESIKDHWQPLGGVSVWSGGYYTQAMAK